MRLRSLSVSVLTGLALLPVCSSPASAADTVVAPRTSTTLAGSIWKNSATKRRLVGPVAVAPRTSTTTAPAPTVSPAQAYQDQVLALTNAERTSRGLRALAPSSCADGYADRWAAALAVAGTLSHQALSPILTACGARGVGENVAYGNVTPAQLVKMWMDSPGHRANILNAAFTHVGVGSVQTSTGRVYGVQVFLTL